MTPQRPVRIGNCSGFYGDRIAAAREMVDGGPIDVLTGDYLAELTMLILWKARQKDPDAGYATTFLTQLEQVLGTCLDRGIKIVSNAGGLNPAGLAAQLGELAARLGLAPKIAWIEGDDLSGRLDELLATGHLLANTDTGQPLADAPAKPVTANAYLGGWGITAALAAGADIVVCPRVTDASLVTGPAAWWHGWARDSYTELAGALVAGHVIECGPQATGGNYSWLDEVTDRRYPGFPIAEVAADGSVVITKHPGTGGLVSAGTVTAQLLYEIAEPAYRNPDVIAHFETVRLAQAGPDRVRITGTQGSPPPPDLKVAINYLGGYRNTMTLVLTGLDIEEKAAWAEQELFDSLGGKDSFAAVDVRLLRFDRPDAPTNEQATAHLRITVKDPDPRKVGRRFSNATMELALGGYAGFHTTTPPTPESAYGVYWPALIPATEVEHTVVLPDGSRQIIPPAERNPTYVGYQPAGPNSTYVGYQPANVRIIRAPLGRVCAARSGDKGGNANVGVWTRDPAAFGWLRHYLTADRVKELIPEAAALPVHRYELPDLSALNFVIAGLLGDGVAASARPDPQAKGLGEYLRSRHVDIPASFLGPAAGPMTEAAAQPRHPVRTRDPARKERILAAAADLVASSGYHAVSMADIGAAAGITGSGIYRHFASKSALLVALFDQAIDGLLRDERRIVHEVRDLRRALLLLVQGQVDFVIAERELAIVYHNEINNLPAADRRRLRRKQRLYLEEWVHLVDELYAGLTDSDARTLVHAAIGAIQSALFHASGLPDERLRELLTTSAEAILGCAETHCAR